MRKTTTTTATLTGSSCTVGELTDFLRGLPADATVRVTCTAGDRPYGQDTVTLTASHPDERTAGPYRNNLTDQRDMEVTPR